MTRCSGKIIGVIRPLFPEALAIDLGVRRKINLVATLMDFPSGLLNTRKEYPSLCFNLLNLYISEVVGGSLKYVGHPLRSLSPTHVPSHLSPTVLVLEINSQ